MENAPTSAPNSTLSLSASRSLSSSLAISTKSFTTTGEKIVPGPHLSTQANSAPSSDVDWIGVVRTTYGNWIEHPRPTFHNLIHQCAGTNHPDHHTPSNPESAHGAQSYRTRKLPVAPPTARPGTWHQNKKESATHARKSAVCILTTRQAKRQRLDCRIETLELCEFICCSLEVFGGFFFVVVLWGFLFGLGR